MITKVMFWIVSIVMILVTVAAASVSGYWSFSLGSKLGTELHNRGYGIDVPHTQINVPTSSQFGNSYSTPTRSSSTASYSTSSRQHYRSNFDRSSRLSGPVRFSGQSRGFAHSDRGFGPSGTYSMRESMMHPTTFSRSYISSNRYQNSFRYVGLDSTINYRTYDFNRVIP